MLDPDKFKHLFSEYWWTRLGPWFETEEAFKTYSILKERSKQGAKIFPTNDRTFRAFKLSTSSPRAVFVGLSPYHTIGKNRMPNADGLAFSTSLTKEETPSLKSFYDAMESDLGAKVQRSPNLDYLAEQNVLLLNYSLTTELGKATIHADMDLWDDFNRFFYSSVLGGTCGIPVALMGKKAQTLERYLFGMCHVIKKIEHPVMAAREHRDWRHDGLFKWTNKILTENNGPNHEIWWDKTEMDELPWN